MHINSDSDIDEAIQHITSKIKDMFGPDLAYNKYVQEGLEKLKNKDELDGKDLQYTVRDIYTANSDKQTECEVEIYYSDEEDDTIEFEANYCTFKFSKKESEEEE
jgi:hypothetical protein